MVYLGIEALDLGVSLENIQLINQSNLNKNKHAYYIGKHKKAKQRLSFEYN
jgi:hypothetical protein